MAKKPSPVVFDAAFFDADLERASDAGREVAEATRDRFEKEVPFDELRLCRAEGTEGTELPRCFKIYLPDAAGRFGMVFQLEIIEKRGVLRYLAFGVRHHPRESNAPTVYEIAHRRLHEEDS